MIRREYFTKDGHTYFKITNNIYRNENFAGATGTLKAKVTLVCKACGKTDYIEVDLSNSVRNRLEDDQNFTTEFKKAHKNCIAST
jgi:hypothetical protein